MGLEVFTIPLAVVGLLFIVITLADYLLVAGTAFNDGSIFWIVLGVIVVAVAAYIYEKT